MEEKKISLEQEILQSIEEAAIAPFIVDEVKTVFDHLNAYKLTNMINNHELFLNFISEIDQLNTDMYKATEGVTAKTEDTTLLSDELKQFISITGWMQLSKKEREAFLAGPMDEILQKSTLIRGWFLLSLSDFAQGSHCRLENKYHYKIDKLHYHRIRK